MSTWRAFNMAMVPGVPETLEAVQAAADILKTALGILVDALEILKDLILEISDPLQAALAALMAVIHELVERIRNLLASGVFFYIDKGPYFTDGQPDGLPGFIARWAESFEDQGNEQRPQINEETPISALIMVVGAQQLTEFGSLLALLGKLFEIPGLKLNISFDQLYMAAIEESMSTPPDWKSATLGDILPSLEELTFILDFAMKLLQIGKGYADMLLQVIEIIEEKVAILTAISDQIQAMVDNITTIINAAGIYVLHLEATGIPDLIEQAQSAQSAPNWALETWVAGVCLLGASAEFGPVLELFGGGNE